jgi:hypothetical protein
MPTPVFPCRLSVILAREAPVGVIFRRGPSDWTQIIKWNTDADSFEPGAWFKGRIYPERCDLSPDGSLLIYFALNYAVGRGDEDFPSSYTAISKVPWLTALAVWPNGGTYYGGGLFETNTTVWPNPACEFEALPSYAPQGLEVSYDHRFWDHEWHLLFRLERDGWKVIEPYPPGSVPVYRLLNNGELDPSSAYVMEATNPNCPLLTHFQTVHQKDTLDGTYSLVMTSTYDYLEQGNRRTFEIRDNQHQEMLLLKDVHWADLDQRGRLVYAKEGKLFAAVSRRGVEIEASELVDFNSSRPEKTKSPDWARHW